MVKNELRKESNEFWDDVFSCDYPFNKENVYKELSDFYFLMEQIPEIYCTVTGGKLSKTMYNSKTIIEAYEEYLNKTCEEHTKEKLTYLLEEIEECNDKNEIIDLIRIKLDE